jgi:hypothetical protein
MMLNQGFPGARRARVTPDHTWPPRSPDMIVKDFDFDVKKARYTRANPS